MKILLLAPHPFFQNRGTPIAVRLLAEILAKNNHEVVIFTYPEGEDLDNPKIKIKRIQEKMGVKNVKPGPSWKKIFYDYYMYRELKQFLKHNQFDLIHAVEESAYMAKKLGPKYGLKYIYDMDSSMAQQIVEKFGFLKSVEFIFEQFEKTIIKNSIGVIPVCKALEDTVRKYDSNIPLQRLEDISLLPDELPKIEDEPALSDLKNKIIMYVGNLEVYQGIDLLMDGFAEANKEYKAAKLVIVGGNEADIDKYKQKGEKLGISNNLVFLGPKPIEHLKYYLSKADILASPRTRGFNTPMKIYSYLDSGKPVIATDLPTHTQVLTNSVSMLVEPKPMAMADGLVKLLSNEKLSAELAENAKKLVQAEFTMDAYERKLMSFYDKLIDNAKQNGKL